MLEAATDPRVNQRRARVLVAAAALPAGVVLGLVGLLGGALVAVVVFVVVTLLVGGALWATADRRALAALDAAPADPVGHARLLNLVEGLCVAAGLAVPRVLVVDDRACNAVAVGRDPRRATLAFTTALLEVLSLIELEGVVAELLVRVKRRDTLPGTVAAGTGGLGRRLGHPADRDEDTDLDAVALTRYPPGLAAALEKMHERGTAVAGPSARLGELWLADPSVERSSGPATPRRSPLAQRVEALREL